MTYDGMERRSSGDVSKTLADIHDTLIRLEPVCKQVEKHNKVLYNDGWGMVTQIRILWLASIGLWTIFLVWVRAEFQ